MAKRVKKRATKPKRKPATKPGDDALRWEHYHSIPQKHWREMSGRQARTLIEQAERYGIPFAGATVDLPAVVLALHDFFASNAAALSSTEADRRLKIARARIADVEADIKEGKVVMVGVAEKDRLAIVRYFLGVMERAGSELAGKLAGKRPADQRKAVRAYFDNVRAEMCK